LPEHIQANIKESLETSLRKERSFKSKKVLFNSRMIKAMHDDNHDVVQENLRRVFGPAIGADSDDEQALMDREPWLYNQIQKSPSILKKREIKALRKEQQVFNLYTQGVKPSLISKQMKLLPATVNTMLQNMRITTKKIDASLRDGQQSQSCQTNSRATLKENPLILKAITKYLDENGIYNLKLDSLRQHLVGVLPPGSAPCASTLLDILKRKFFLCFNRLQTSTTKYFEGTYAEKRLWVSRLLAQFFHDGAIIVSVDESNFRSDLTKSWSW
jgi:hypothetical protein